MKKVWKTTRPFRYDLNQIPYDYRVEVSNTFKGLDLTECLMIYGMRFVTLYSRQEIKTIPIEKKCKKAKWLSGEALQIAEKRREVKGQGEERYTRLNAEFQRIARRDKKAFRRDQCKEMQKTKMAVWGGLTNSCEKKRGEKQRRGKI